MTERAGIIIIGDEILSGLVQDSNAFMHIEDYNLMITLESYDRNSLHNAFQDLMSSLSSDNIIKVEE